MVLVESDIPVTDSQEHNTSSDEHSRESTADREAFMQACTEVGIPLEVAQSAQEQSDARHSKWWSGLRIEEEIDKKNGEKMSSSNKKQIGPEQESPNQLRQPNYLYLPNNPGFSNAAASSMLRSAKIQVMEALRVFRGDTTNPRFLDALTALRSIYTGTGHDARCQRSQVQFEGDWMTLSRPNFKQCLGRNRKGDFVYTLGRMSFDMFRPTGLRCSIQKIMHDVHVVEEEAERPTSCVPRGLKDEVFGHRGVLRTYNIKILFTIESRDDIKGMEPTEGEEEQEMDETYRIPSKPIKAEMTNVGYMLPDPSTPNRFTVWFTGGTVAPVVEEKTGSSTPRSHRSSPASRPTSSSQQMSSPSARICPLISETSSSQAGPSCTLPLHECRRRNKHCLLHGIDRRAAKKTIEDRNKRYVRPRYGPGSNTGLTPSTGLFASAMDGPYSAEWEDIFAPEDTWKRSLGEQAKALAAKVLLGAEVPDKMEDDGTMSFTLHRPIGGHGKSFVDVLYLDKDLRITKGNNGSIFVQTREGIDAAAPSMAGSQPRRRAVRKHVHGGASAA